MPLVVLRIGSMLWAFLLRALAVVGHRRAKARVVIRQEGQTRVLAHRGAPFMWFHVASLGELEQAIPVMQAQHASSRNAVVLTVNSPSACTRFSRRACPTSSKDGARTMCSRCFRTIAGHRRTWLGEVPIQALLSKYDLAQPSCGLPGGATSGACLAAAPSGTGPNPTPSTPALWRLQRPSAFAGLEKRFVGLASPRGCT